MMAMIRPYDAGDDDDDDYDDLRVGTRRNTKKWKTQRMMDGWME
jgi:hypothetical protein